MTAELAEPWPRDLAEYSQAVGARLRAARRSRGWTLWDLADLTGLTPTRISSWENARRGISMEPLAGLCAVLGVRVADIVSGDAPDAPDAPWCRTCGRPR